MAVGSVPGGMFIYLFIFMCICADGTSVCGLVGYMFAGRLENLWQDSRSRYMKN